MNPIFAVRNHFVCSYFYFDLKKLLNFIFSAFSLSNMFLKGNKLRSALSVLGIAIGIFCIVAVLTFASSMKNNVRANLETLGMNVVFIEKWPWFGGGEYKWWDFVNRPEANYKEYKIIKQRYSQDIVRDIGFECSISGITIKYGTKSCLLYTSPSPRD